MKLKCQTKFTKLRGFLVQTSNDEPVMVLYHKYGFPTVRTAAPNHFGCLCGINTGTIRNWNEENSSEKGMYSEELVLKKKDKLEPKKETLSNYCGEMET